MEFILSKSKLKRRVTVEEHENSANVCKRKDDRPIFPEIAFNKNITDNRKFRKKRSTTYAEAVRSVGTSNSDAEVPEPLKAPNVFKEETTISTEPWVYI